MRMLDKIIIGRGPVTWPRQFSIELGRRRLSKNAAYYICALEPLKPLVSLV